VIARVVLLLEDRVQAAVVRLLLGLGSPVRAEVFPGFGADGRVRVRGRVLLGSARLGRQRRVTALSSLRENLSQFLTVEVPWASVRVDVGARSEVLVSDREGYLDAVLDEVHLAPGRHPVRLTPLQPVGQPASGTVHLPDPGADLVVVSDIDDTIIDSGIAHGLLATVRTALLLDASTRVPLEGAPALYRAMARDADGPERPFVYLSTSPWNLVGFLKRFLKQHRFPPGPLLLTDWGPGVGGLLRVGTQEHKLTALRQLAELLPRPRFVLVGDSGQQDAAIYRDFALEHPGRVAAVYIRLAADDPARQRHLDEVAQVLQQAQVPFVVAADSAGMLRHAQEHGLAAASG
jgi:phosphatidate phosphatase APP1